LIFSKCIAFGGDNANVNFGGLGRLGKNNTFTKLKAHLGNDIEGIGCPAHILHNTIQTAADQLSCDVEQIVMKIFGHFSIYTVRIESLKNFCGFLDVEYHKLLSHSKTRWLSLFPSVERILKLFEPLKSFFLSTEKAPKTILDFFNNPLSESYFWFIHSQISSFHNQILKIEGRSKSVIEVHEILLTTLAMSKAQAESNFIPLEIKALFRKLLNEGTITQYDINTFMTDISLFYETLISYLTKWIKPMDIFTSFHWMTLKTAPVWDDVEDTYNYLKSKNVILNSTFLFNQIAVVQDIVKQQLSGEDSRKTWNDKLLNEKWVFLFENMETDVPEQFADIYKICEYIFSVPGHNGNVERIFSLMEIQWTDERNRLIPETIEGILQCIVNFKFNSCSEMYDYAINCPELLKEGKSSNKYTK
jgi:hypothetical protein